MVTVNIRMTEMEMRVPCGVVTKRMLVTSMGTLGEFKEATHMVALSFQMVLLNGARLDSGDIVLLSTASGNGDT